MQLDTLERKLAGTRRPAVDAVERQRQSHCLRDANIHGGVVALSRRLYVRLHGFDTDMVSWGSEDVDLGVQCWLLGHPVYHDPVPLVGHRFQKSFDTYTVPIGTCAGQSTENGPQDILGPRLGGVAAVVSTAATA